MLNITNLHTRRFTNSFIYNKELRALLHNLKTKAFELNGIIFGEIVLNSIIFVISLLCGKEYSGNSVLKLSS